MRKKEKNFDKSLSYKLKLIVAHKDILRNHVSFFFERYAKLFREHQLNAARQLREKWVNVEKGGDKIKVAFFITIPGMWKVDYLFKAMMDDPHFQPCVVILPYSAYKGFEKEEINSTIENTRKFISQKGYDYVIPRNKNGKWEDVKKTIHPDIVFFSSPYKDVIPQYYIYHFIDVFTCYVPYGLTIMNTYKNNYDLIFHNLVGVYFLESPFNREMSQIYSRIKGINVEVSGFLPSEVFLRKDYRPENRWKPQSKNKKKVIWAPHHTVESESKWSTFLHCCDEMVLLAKKYKDSVQFSFKPHQLLKFKLQKIWGEERTEAYYRIWAEMENTQLEESTYVDLFLTSDAMIHDSGSFTMEYLFTQKPVMYLARDISFKDRFSIEGQKAFDCHYIGFTSNDIDRFLSDVVLEGNDPKCECRQQFYNTTLNAEGSALPSERVLQIINQYVFEK